MLLIDRVRASDLFSWTDLFCGAGGSSSGIESVPGCRVVMAAIQFPTRVSDFVIG